MLQFRSIFCLQYFKLVLFQRLRLLFIIRLKINVLRQLNIKSNFFRLDIHFNSQSKWLILIVLNPIA